MIDKKDLVILEKYSNGKALLFDKGAAEPFIVANGFHEETMDWDWGKYFADAASAGVYADPKILNDISILVTIYDLKKEWTDKMLENGYSFGEAADSLDSSEFEGFVYAVNDSVDPDLFRDSIKATVDDVAKDYIMAFMERPNRESSR